MFIAVQTFPELLGLNCAHEHYSRFASPQVISRASSLLIYLETMASSAISTDLGQLALSNLPRKAKIAPVSRPILPKDNDYDATSEDDDDSEPSWAPPPSSSRRRGRKPANVALSHSAREAQRRENHSRIEKLRRTKINDALATLRELVPQEYGRAIEDPDQQQSNELDGAPKPGKKAPKEKEFKLEILVSFTPFQDL